MTDWGITPRIVNEEFTEELLSLMMDKRNKRIRAMNNPENSRQADRKNRVSDSEFFSMIGVTVQKGGSN